MGDQRTGPVNRGADDQTDERTVVWLDELILKGLLLVRKLRERRGADPGELDMYAEAIDRFRDQLADVVTSKTLHEAAA